MSDSVRPRRQQLTRLCHCWDSPGKNTGVGCHFLLQCMKVKSESEVAQSCLTLSDPMDCSLPGSSIPGILQSRVLEWVAIAFSVYLMIDAYIFNFVKNCHCVVLFCISTQWYLRVLVHWHPCQDLKFLVFWILALVCICCGISLFSLTEVHLIYNIIFQVYNIVIQYFWFIFHLKLL